jgi:glycosyltransferase involved in cell wall biosynthesis
LESASCQDYPSIEIVVADDASTDETLAIAGSFADDRVRILRSRRRLGMAANWNRAIHEARGEYIKMLMQDDRLAPDCVSTMAAVLSRHSSVGFVFAARIVELEDEDNVDAVSWRFRFGNLHSALEPLNELNDGVRLVEIMRRERFAKNHIGEPIVVMIRRAALERVGLFNVRMVQLVDLEMWLRLCAAYDVGFVRRPLATFRVHGASASTRNRLSGAGWLDRVWLLEGLQQDPDLRRYVGWRIELVVWARAVLGEVKREATRILGGRWPEILRHAGEARQYLEFRHARPRPRLHGSLDVPLPVGR